MHQTFKVILIGLYLLGIFATIASVGEERKPITGVSAALGAFLNGAIIVGLIHYL